MGHAYTKKTLHGLSEIQIQQGVLCVATLPILLPLRFYPKEIRQKKGKEPCRARIVKN